MAGRPGSSLPKYQWLVGECLLGNTDLTSQQQKTADIWLGWWVGSCNLMRLWCPIKLAGRLLSFWETWLNRSQPRAHQSGRAVKPSGSAAHWLIGQGSRSLQECRSLPASPANQWIKYFLWVDLASVQPIRNNSTIIANCHRPGLCPQDPASIVRPDF